MSTVPKLRKFYLHNQNSKHSSGSVAYIFECYYVPDTVLSIRGMVVPCLRVYIQKWKTDLKDGKEWKHRGDLEYITVVQGKDDGDFKIQERRGI